MVNPRGEKPIFEQIKDGLRERMLSEVWRQNDKLPSVRELAAISAINPNTIQKAYRDLETEGYIYSVAGKGCYVAEIKPEMLERRHVDLFSKAKALFREMKISKITASDIILVVDEVYERVGAL